jgi:chromosomal replication initiator protein
MVMYLASRHTDLSTPRIGNLLGGRSHATVLHGIDVIEDNEELKNKAEKML